MRISYSWHCCLLIVAPVLCFPYAQADQSLFNMDLEDLLKIKVYSPTRTVQELEDSFIPIFVLTRKDIEQSSALNLAELLDGLPGIDITNNGGIGQNSNIHTRGTNGDHMLFLINDVKQFSATLGRSAFEQIPLSLVDRIEILRGPRSSLYGSEAIGGVVQIYTRTHKEGGTANVGIGGEGQQMAQLGYGQNTAGIDWSTHLAAFKTDNLSASTLGDPDKDAYNNYSLALRLDQNFNEKLDWTLHHFDAHTDGEFDDCSTDFFAPCENKKNVSATGFAMDYQALDKLGLHVHSGRSKDEVLVRVEDVAQDNFDTLLWNHRIQGNYYYSRHTTLTAGVEALDTDVNSSITYDQNKLANRAVYLQLQTYGQQNFLLGARMDDNEVFGEEFTYNMNWQYRSTERHRFGASAGTGYKAPSFNNLYYPGFGNADLQPETSLSYEISYQYKYEQLDWSLHVFHTKVEDLIEYVDTGNFLFRPENVSEARIDGLENIVNLQLAPWNLTLIATWVDPENSTTGEALPGRAKGSVKAGAERHSGDFKFAMEMLARSSRYVSADTSLAGYAIVNLSGQYKLSNRLAFTARIHNLLDKSYESVSNFNSEGLRTIIEIEYAL